MNRDPVVIYPFSFATVAGATAIKSARIDENKSISPMRTTFAFVDRRYMSRPAIRAMRRMYDVITLIVGRSRLEVQPCTSV